MDYEGEWGGGGPGHSWALKWHERSEASASGGGDYKLSRKLFRYTVVPACDAGNPGSIPGRGKLNACHLPGGQLTSTHYSQYKLS